MKKELLAGAATLALVSGAWGSAWAQDDNTANGNTAGAIAQEEGIAVAADEINAQIALQAAVFAGANGAENGAAAGESGAGIGAFSEGNDAVGGDSLQSNTDAFDNEAIARNGSTAVENGAAVIGDGTGYGRDANDNATALDGGIAITTGGGEELLNGLASESEEEVGLATIDGGSVGGDVADDGSVVQLGSGNAAVAAEEFSAAVGTGVAISTAGEFEFGGPAVDDGSSLVVGDDNTTRSADDHSAVTGDDGVAITVDIEEEFFAVGAAAEEESDEESAIASTVPNGNGRFFGGVSGVFGRDNVVADSHLYQETAFIDVTVRDTAHGTQTLTTGDIDTHTVGSLTGANMTALNTGLVNQGASVAIGAVASFGGQ